MPAPLTAAPDFTTLDVRPLDKATAKAVCLEKHYSHKWNASFGTANFGVYRDDRLLGVAAYGNAMNPKAWASVTTTPGEHCIELNRLWVDDELGGNTETWMMGRSFRLLREAGYELVQSFADGRLGVGTIYQAANFTFHGYHETLFHRDTQTGVTYHSTPFSNTAAARAMLTRNALFAEPDRVETFTVRTYRYLYPLNKKARRAVIPAQQPYPKERAGEIPQPGYTPPVGQIARSVAIAEKFADPSLEPLRRYLATITPDPEAAVAKQRENRWVAALAQV